MDTGHRVLWRRLLIASAGAALPLLSLRAQQPGFHAQINLIRLDVVATDETGHPVHGLSKSDFVLRDGGKTVPIEAFAEVRRDAGQSVDSSSQALAPHGPSDVVGNQSPRASRLVVLFIDDTHIWTGRTERVKEIARDVIHKLGPESSMAVLFSGGEHDVEVTQDQDTLLAAVDQFQGRKMVRRPFDGQGCPSPRVKGCDDVAAFFNDLGAYHRLAAAAKLAADTQNGRKAFIFVSESSARELSGLFETQSPPPLPMSENVLARAALAGTNRDSPASSKGTPKSDAVPLKTDPWTVEASANYAAFDLIDMMAALQRSNVSVYSIDPRGAVPSDKLLYECFPIGGADDPCVTGNSKEGPPAWSSWVREAQHSLEHISEASGGIAVVDTDDFTGGLDRIVQDLDNYYLLGFAPPAGKAAAYRPVDVTITRPGVTVRYRHGYDPAGPPLPKNKDPLATLSATVLPARELPLRLTSAVLPGAAGQGQVVLALEISSPLAGLIGADHRVRDTIRYLVTGADLKSKKVARIVEREAHVVLAPTRTEAQRGPDTIAYEVVTSLTLPTGSYQLRSSVSSQGLNLGGSVYETLTIPDFSRVPIAVGGIVLGRVGPGAVPVAESTLAQGVLPFDPILDRDFTSSDELRILAPIGGTDTSVTKAVVELLDAAGASVRTVEANVTETRRLAEYGSTQRLTSMRQAQARVPLSGLAGGDYVLRVSVQSSRDSAHAELNLKIH